MATHGIFSTGCPDCVYGDENNRTEYCPKHRTVELSPLEPLSQGYLLNPNMRYLVVIDPAVKVGAEELEGFRKAFLRIGVLAVIAARGDIRVFELKGEDNDEGTD